MHKRATFFDKEYKNYEQIQGTTINSGLMEVLCSKAPGTTVLKIGTESKNKKKSIAEISSKIFYFVLIGAILAFFAYQLYFKITHNGFGTDRVKLIAEPYSNRLKISDSLYEIDKMDRPISGEDLSLVYSIDEDDETYVETFASLEF